MSNFVLARVPPILQAEAYDFHLWSNPLEWLCEVMEFEVSHAIQLQPNIQE